MTDQLGPGGEVEGRRPSPRVVIAQRDEVLVTRKELTALRAKERAHGAYLRACR